MPGISKELLFALDRKRKKLHKKEKWHKAIKAVDCMQRIEEGLKMQDTGENDDGEVALVMGIAILYREMYRYNIGRESQSKRAMHEHLNAINGMSENGVYSENMFFFDHMYRNIAFLSTSMDCHSLGITACRDHYEFCCSAAEAFPAEDVRQYYIQQLQEDTVDIANHIKAWSEDRTPLFENGEQICKVVAQKENSMYMHVTGDMLDFRVYCESITYGTRRPCLSGNVYRGQRYPASAFEYEWAENESVPFISHLFIYIKLAGGSATLNCAIHDAIILPPARPDTPELF